METADFLKSCGVVLLCIVAVFELVCVVPTERPIGLKGERHSLPAKMLVSTTKYFKGSEFVASSGTWSFLLLLVFHSAALLVEQPEKY